MRLSKYALTGYEYDDLLVIPKISDVLSRDTPDISINIGGTKIEFPLIASPMKNVVDVNFLKSLSDLGGIGIHHRFDPVSKLKEDFYGLRDKYNFGISIGLDQDFEYILQEIRPNIILIDIANGYLRSLHSKVEQIKNYIIKNRLNETVVCAGNVATYSGAKELKNSGADIIRVGIGNGSNCSTRNVTGIGVPSITAIDDCYSVNDNTTPNVMIMADGGVNSSGNFVKSIVAGADFCMSGRLFAETYESPSEGKIYGMASRTHQEDMSYEIKSIEGFDSEINKKHSLDTFIKEFSYGIKSACTYLNSNNLSEIKNNGTFVKVSDYAIKKGL